MSPPCVRICPVTAMYQRADGIVEFDSNACVGCKACMQACPYDAIYIDPETHTAAKCHYCAHRINVGLEPACVVVCPEHAIIAGNMDDPQTEISRLLARQKVTTRKPEQGTAPKLFYINGNEIALHPQIPWHWPVPAYLVTKGIGSGLFMILSLGWGLGLFPFDGLTAVIGGLLALLFIALTTGLLVYDLDRPERFCPSSRVPNGAVG